MFVEAGTTNGDKGFVCTSNVGSDVVGTNNLTFTQFTGTGGSSDLDGLTDVVITSAASGDFLRHNGTNWVDATISASDLPAMVGDSGSGGTKGAVPAPAAGDVWKMIEPPALAPLLRPPAMVRFPPRPSEVIRSGPLNI